MLSISITGTIAIGLAILGLVGMFLYWGKKGPDNDDLTDDGNDPLEDSELIYGAAIQVDDRFARVHGLSVGEYYFITIPTSDTPVNYIRVTTNNGDLDVPRHRIKSIIYDIETGTAASPYEKKYREVDASKRYVDPFSQGIIAQMAYGQQINDTYIDGSYKDEIETKTFGNGGEFAGGGTSGRWIDSHPENPFADTDHNREMRGLVEQIPDKAGVGEIGGKFIPFEEILPRTEVTFNSIFNDDNRSAVKEAIDQAIIEHSIDNNHASIYEPASHQSYYGSSNSDTTSSHDHGSSSYSHDSSSSYDSGSSSYDSGSSDSGSSSSSSD
jgi:hypothetical protein